MRIILSKYMYVKFRILGYCSLFEQYKRNKSNNVHQKQIYNLHPERRGKPLSAVHVPSLPLNAQCISHTLTHITEHPNFTLKAGAHCSLLASPVAGVRRHQDFHSMKVVLPRPHPMKIKNISMAIIKKSLVFKHFLRFLFTLYTSILYQKT